MSIGGIHHEWLIENANWMLNVGGALEVPEGSFRDLLLEAPEILADMSKGKKRAGSDEAIAASFVKTMNGLKDLATHLEKRNPAEFRELAKSMGNGADEALGPAKRTHIPPKEAKDIARILEVKARTPVARPATYGMPAASSQEQYLNRGAPYVSTARQRGLELVAIGETQAVMPPVAWGFKVDWGLFKWPLNKRLKAPVFWVLAIALGLLLFALGTEPAITVDIGLHLFWFVPAYVHFFVTEVLKRLRFRTLAMIDHAVGGHMGYAALEYDSLSSRPRPEMTLPASQAAAYFYPFFAVYLSLALIVYHVLIK